MTDIEKIKFIREALRKNQEDFAAPLGIKQNTYSRYESGAKELPKNFIKLLFMEYNVNPDWWNNETKPVFIPKGIIENEEVKTSMEKEILKIKLEHEQAKSSWYELQIELLKENIELLKDQNKTLKEKVRT